MEGARRYPARRLASANPDGTVAVVYMEVDDIPRAMEGVASSDDPFNQWFRERVQDVHGIDLQSQSPPQSQQIHDHNF